MEEKQAIQYVRKSDGGLAAFSEKKLRRSLTRSGATDETADGIIASLRPRLYPGISTREIYDQAFGMLKDRMRPAAARYHLKRAILELGPSGFPFEQFIGELFRRRGYNVQTNQFVTGHCVRHEVDVMATTAGEKNFIECKYHQAGIKCDVKVALYVHARFQDIARSFEKTSPGNLHGWLITNSRFSSDALQYSNCVGLQLLSWDHPSGKSLRDIIDQEQLYPVTCLTTLSHYEKSRLLHLGVVLCSDLLGRPGALNEAGVPPGKADRVLEEAGTLCAKEQHHRKQKDKKSPA
ncbi:restriction endonuclease [Chitinophaga sp. NPDC101104]|uniref:restriction endonuclease n=1 Tax=Chitinophaga sp. NPDC101104 TaxID=3390561 RepID=UPI003D009F07